MEMVRKKLLTPGTFHAPQAKFVANRDRLQKHVQKFKQLKSEGYIFPVPWGHRLSAIPERRLVTESQYHKALEQRAFEEARYNAGYVDDLNIDKDGDLEISLPAPPGYRVDHATGDLVNETDGTKIREVSGAFGDWTDGKGRTHKDILIHAALCVRPVWGDGQPGFQLASDNSTTLATGAVRYTHTLSTRTGGSSMAKPKKDYKLDGLEDEADLDELPDEEIVPETDTVTETPDEPIAPVKVKSPDMFEQCLALLNQAGLQLAAHTTEENFFENLVTALTVAISMGAKFERAESDPQPDAAAQTTEDGQQGAPPTPEAPPLMMSTVAQYTDEQLAEVGLQRVQPVMLSTDKMTDRERVWADKEAKRVRRTIASHYRFCRDKLGLFPDIAERKIAQTNVVQLSLLPNGDSVPPPELHTVLLVKEILQRMGGIDPSKVPAQTTTLATARTVPNPMAAKTKQQQDSGSFAERMLRKATGNPDAKLAEVR